MNNKKDIEIYKNTFPKIVPFNISYYYRNEYFYNIIVHHYKRYV